MNDGRRQVVRRAPRGGILAAGAKDRPHGPGPCSALIEARLAIVEQENPRLALTMAVLWYAGPREPRGTPGQ